MPKTLLVVGFVGFLIGDRVSHRAGVGTPSPRVRVPKKSAGGLSAPCLEPLARSVVEVELIFPDSL